MKVEDIYVLAKELLDTNLNTQVHLDQSRFVLFFNKVQLDYLRKVLDTTESSDKVQRVQRFLVPSTRLHQVDSKVNNMQLFKLPDDYIKKEDLIVTANKGKCSDIMYVEEIKPSNISVYLSDQYLKPSYEFRESFYYVGNDSISIFNDGTFKIDDISMIYYRKPVNIEMPGYINESGELSTKAVESEWSDVEISEILELFVFRYATAKAPIKSNN